MRFDFTRLNKSQNKFPNTVKKIHRKSLVMNLK